MLWCHFKVGEGLLLDVTDSGVDDGWRVQCLLLVSWDGVTLSVGTVVTIGDVMVSLIVKWMNGAVLTIGVMWCTDN